MSTHLAIALADFPNFDSIPDKELYFILEKYKCEKELDIVPTSDFSDIYSGGLQIEEEDIFEDDEY